MAVLGTALLSASCGEASEERPTTAGTIAFIRGGSSKFDDAGPIFIMNADGTKERRITDLLAFDFDRSLDGQRISYDGGTNAISGIDGMYVWDAESGNGGRLQVDSCYGPVLSDNGVRVACEYTEPHWIKVVNADGTDVQLITHDGCYRPSWSPDGRQIAYVSFGRWHNNQVSGPSGVFVMNADGSGKRRVAREYDDNQAPQWSPDGRTLAYLADGDIWLVRLHDGQTKRILDSGERATKELAWSPDGTRLAFTHGDGDFEIFVVNVDGSGLKNLTDNERVADESPSWSPDGTAIAFTSLRDGNYEIYTMHADGSGETRLTTNAVNDSAPLWSP